MTFINSWLYFLCKSEGMDQEDLFKKYIDICNVALEKNKGRFPFNHIFYGLNNKKNAESIRVKIINDIGDPQFYLQLNEGEIKYDLMACKNTCHTCQSVCPSKESVWQVKESYLKDVTENPENYIGNPAKLDWEWASLNKDEY